MKKFAFNLESLMGLREWEEQSSRQAFSEISQEVNRLQERIANVDSEKSAMFDQWGESKSESFSRNDRLALMGRIDAIGRRAEEAKAALDEAIKKRERALAKMVKCIHEKKVVENLKERRLEEYRADVFREETHEIEDAYNCRRNGRNDS